MESRRVDKSLRSLFHGRRTTSRSGAPLCRGRIRSLRLLALASAALLGLALSGCATPAAADSGVVLSDVYTSVAQTLAARPSPVTMTATLDATSTPVATVTPFEDLPATVTAGTVWNSSSYAGGCDNSAYVSDVTIPDGTELAPGEAFTKTWALVNTGNCTWNGDYSMTFISGDDMEGSEATIGRSVAPGQSADISVSLTAPEDTGTYTGYWRLANAGGTSFGEDVYVMVTVSDEASTDTATATPMPTIVSPTATPTFTAASPALTSTATAASRPTATPTPTATSPDLTPTATAASSTATPTDTAVSPTLEPTASATATAGTPTPMPASAFDGHRAATTPLATQNG